MKILITGHMGFVGKNLYKKLADLNYKVAGFDILNGDDLLDFERLENVIKNVEVVFHFAADINMNDMETGIDEVNKALSTNIIGTQNVAFLCAKYKKWLIFSSSASVYGNTEDKVDKIFLDLNPIGMYANSKYCGEIIIKMLSTSFGLEYTILRFSSVYGFGMRDSSGIKTFINQAIKGESLSVYGDGQSSRCFIFIEDLVDACVCVLKSKDKAVNQTIDISGTESISADKMAKDIKKNIKSLSSIIYIPQRKDFIKRESLSADRAAFLLDWRAKTSWSDGIKLIIKNMLN